MGPSWLDHGDSHGAGGVFRALGCEPLCEPDVQMSNTIKS